MNPQNWKTIPKSLLPIMAICSLIGSCSNKTQFVESEPYEYSITSQKINCQDITIPWLYIDGNAMVNLAKGTYKNMPLYFSNKIVSCTIFNSGWFMHKGNSSKHREFDPGPQLKALPVSNGCGVTLSLPEGAYLSDFTIEKKEIKKIIDAQSPWIILQPELIVSNNEVFVKWKIWDTEINPGMPCNESALYNHNFSGNGQIFHRANFIEFPLAPLQPRNEFGYANPVPPYPAEL